MTFLDIIFIIFVILFFISTSPHNVTPFDKGTTASIRGLCMISIILSHICIHCGLFSHVLIPAGHLSTSFFFFVSGYGNQLSTNKISSRWLLKKYAKICKPFLFCYAIFCLYLAIFNNLPPIRDILVDIFTLSLPNTINWFSKIIVLCFTLHFISKIIAKKELYQILLLDLSIFTYMLIGQYFKLDSMWVNSVHCYAIGATLSLLVKSNLFNIKHILQQNKISLFYLSLFALVPIVYISELKWYFTLFSAIVFASFCFLFSYIFTTRSRFFEWIGNNSFEFYLFHIFAYNTVQFTLNTSHHLYALLVFFITFVIVFSYTLLVKLISTLTAIKNN